VHTNDWALRFRTQISPTPPPNHHKAAMVTARINGSQCFGEFSSENEQEWTNFGCRPEAFSRWAD